MKATFLVKMWRVCRNPGLAIDYLYFLTRGIRIRGLRDERDTLRGTLDALAALAAPLPVVPLDEMYPETASSRELGELFAQYGSDKASKHNYHLLYSLVLEARRAEPLQILEIGLGTNDISRVSHMGAEGKPGASVRAFRDWAPLAQVRGADIDESILFREERIETFFVDQTDPQSLESLAAQFFHRGFDLIIDDGLHNPWANLNTLRALLPLRKPGGAYVIEDILERDRPVFGILRALLPPEMIPQMFQSRSGEYCLVVQEALEPSGG
jgi:hypothetical protein